MDLAVAVGAEQNALGELGRDLLPWSRDAVRGDREVLRPGLDMMEFEGRHGEWALAALASTAKQIDRALLCPAPKLDDRYTIALSCRCMERAVAIRADEIALGCL